MHPADDSAPHPADALRQAGIAALRAGDSATARRLLSEALAAHPDDLDAWLWLSGAVANDAERRYCLLRVQALNPAHAAAARGLEKLPVVVPLDPLPASAPTPPAAVVPLREASPKQSEPPADEPILSKAEPPAVTPVESKPEPPAVESRSQKPEPAPTKTTPPLPPVEERRSAGFPSWLFWTAVAGLSLVLLLMVGCIALRLINGNRPTHMAAQPGPPATTPTRRPTATLRRTATPGATATAAPTVVQPGDDSAAALLARGLIRERIDEDKQGALADYTAAITMDPTYAEGYYLRAVLRINLGDTQGAQDDYTRGLQLDSTSAKALYHRGRMAAQNGNSDEAIKDYTRAIELDPNYAQAYYSRAVERGNRNEFQEALNDYSLSIKADPTFAGAYYNRGLLHMNMGENQAAMDDYTRAIQLNDRFFRAYYNRGFMFAYIYADNQRALKDFDRSVELRPQALDARCERGAARSRVGDHQGGLEDTNRALELNPDYACAYYTRGHIYIHLQKYEQAITDYTQFISMVSPPAAQSAYVNRGIAYRKLKKYQAALDDDAEAIRLSPNDPLPYNDRGQTYVEMGDYAAARKEWTKAAELYRQLGQMADYQRLTQALKQLP